MKLSFGRKTQAPDKPAPDSFPFGWVVGTPFGPDMLQLGLDRDPKLGLVATVWLHGERLGGEVLARVAVRTSIFDEFVRWGRASAGCWRWQAQERCNLKPRGRDGTLDIPAISLCYGPNDSRMPFQIDSPAVRANPGRYLLLVEIKPEFVVHAARPAHGPVHGGVLVEPKQMSEFAEWVKRRSPIVMANRES